MEQGNHLLLQLAPHIDHEITTTDQVEFGKWRVFDHVLFGKNQRVADTLVDAIGFTVGFQRKKARQPFRGDVVGDAGGKESFAGLTDGLAVYVGGKELKHVVLFQCLHMFLEQDGDGVGLFAG